MDRLLERGMRRVSTREGLRDGEKERVCMRDDESESVDMWI